MRVETFGAITVVRRVTDSYKSQVMRAAQAALCVAGRR